MVLFVGRLLAEGCPFSDPLACSKSCLLFGNNPVPARRLGAVEGAVRAYQQGWPITPLGGGGGQTYADRSQKGLLPRTLDGAGTEVA